MKPNKKQQRELAEYREFVVSTKSLNPNFSGRTGVSSVTVKNRPLQPLRPPPGRSFPEVNQKPSFVGSTGKRDTLSYSGTKMLGIGTLHKSNAVPVFSEDEAIDLATMRRN